MINCKKDFSVTGALVLLVPFLLLTAIILVCAVTLVGLLLQLITLGLGISGNTVALLISAGSSVATVALACLGFWTLKWQKENAESERNFRELEQNRRAEAAKGIVPLNIAELQPYCDEIATQNEALLAYASPDRGQMKKLANTSDAREILEITADPKGSRVPMPATATAPSMDLDLILQYSANCDPEIAKQINQLFAVFQTTKSLHEDLFRSDFYAQPLMAMAVHRSTARAAILRSYSSNFLSHFHSTAPYIEPSAESAKEEVGLWELKGLICQTHKSSSKRCIPEQMSYYRTSHILTQLDNVASYKEPTSVG